MVLEPLRPARGGFLRPFGCGWFIREFLLGNTPYESPAIDPEIGCPQADIFYHYKQALRRVTAEDRAVRQEEKSARRAKRPINPDNIEALTKNILRDCLTSRGAAAIIHSSTISPRFRSWTGWSRRV